MNPVTTIELMQVVGITAGAMVGLIGVFAGVFIWAANVRDKEIGKRLQAVEQTGRAPPPGNDARSQPPTRK